MMFYPNVFAYELLAGKQPAELRKRLYGITSDKHKSQIIAKYYKEKRDGKTRLETKR